MKRILVVATTSFTGMGHYDCEVVNNFNAGDNIYFLFHDYEDDYFKKNVKAELHAKSFFAKHSNSKWNKLYNLFFNRFPYDGKIIELCKEKHINLVHYIDHCPSVRMQKKIEKMGISILTTVHDLHPHDAKKAWYKMIRHYVREYRRHKDVAYAKHLLTNCQDQYDELKDMFPQKTVDYHAFPTLISEKIAKGGTVVPELKGLNKPYILFFGRIEEYKGIKYLYQAFVENDDLNENNFLVIAGTGSLGFKRVDSEKNVLFLNRYIKDDEIRNLYESAACVVYPYISATQSGVLSVAFYFRTPTIASNIPFFNRIMSPFNAGVLFEKGNVKDLTLKLREILKMDVSELKSNESLCYETLYNNDSLRQRLLEIYQRVLELK